jgi:hypothetical protein
MRANEQRTLRWQQRTRVLERNTRQLQSLLNARTKTLNARVDQLNRVGGKLVAAQTALDRSQGDVAGLEERQRQLANEKAQIEDQAHMLDQVAAAYVSCKGDLIQLLSDFANGYDTSYSFDAANTSCTGADDQLQTYLGAYPNG